MTRVLVVDDEDAILDVIQRILVDEGVSVVTAHDAEEAVERFRGEATNIDCILLDVNMPGLGGEEAFALLRGIRPDVPIIIGSGRYPEEVLQRLGSRAVASVATKPYRIGELMDHIDKALTWTPEAGGS